MNECMFMGRLTKDLELKYVGTDNKPLCKGTLAVPRGYSKGDGNPVTDFINFVVWGKLAETLVKYKRKGEQLIIKGPLYKTKVSTDTGDRYYDEINVEKLYFTDSKKSSSDSNPSTTTDASTLIIDDDELPF